MPSGFHLLDVGRFIMFVGVDGNGSCGQSPKRAIASSRPLLRAMAARREREPPSLRHCDKSVIGGSRVSNPILLLR